ncbi:MAG TPA: O-antigen ligase family protein [Bryobacteraceae bacterium]|nr:O-antigen ligase family protein [Bryobacteraceae bacterium]
MMSAAGSAARRQIIAGAALGLYAAAFAIVPGIALKAALCAPLILIPTIWWVLNGARRWLLLFLLAALLLPPLPFAIGNSGPHVALLFAAAGVFIGLLRLSEWQFQSDDLTMTILALFAVLAGSITMAALYSGFVIAAGSFARVLLFGISVYVFLYVRHGPAVREDSFRLIRILFWAASASALFACVDFYFQFPAPAGYGPQFIWLDTGVFRRAQGFFYEASTLGNLCACFLLMIAVALFRPRKERPVPIAAMLAGGTALAAALVLSYSRASLLNLGVALTVLLWLHRKRIRVGQWFASLIVFASACAAILTGAFPVFTEAYWMRLRLSVEYFVESPNAVLSGRLRSWEVLRDFLFAHPWYAVLGVGYKTLPYSHFIGTTAIADNTYLSMLAETGIIGLFAVVCLNAVILRAAYRASRASDARRSFCGTWMLCFWAGQVVQMLSADLLTYWRVLPVYFCVLALAARGESHEHSVSRSIQ